MASNPTVRRRPRLESSSDPPFPCAHHLFARVCPCHSPISKPTMSFYLSNHPGGMVRKVERGGGPAGSFPPPSAEAGHPGSSLCDLRGWTVFVPQPQLRPHGTGPLLRPGVPPLRRPRPGQRGLPPSGGAVTRGGGRKVSVGPKFVLKIFVVGSLHFFKFIYIFGFIFF